MSWRNRIIMVSLFSTLAPSISRAASSVSNFYDELKKTTVFIARAKYPSPDDTGSPFSFVGTGVIIDVDGQHHVLTAKHNVIDPKTGSFIDSDLLIGYNSKDGKIETQQIQNTKNDLKVEWMTHKSTSVDLAIMPFGFNSKYDDVKSIEKDFSAPTDKLEQMYDVFFTGFLPDVLNEQRADAVLRKGIVSRIDADKTILIEAYAYPGNSGSPVFVMPTPSRDHVSIVVGTDELAFKFVGIIGDYIPYRDMAISKRSGRPRVEFEDNTGLTKVWTMALVNEIIARPMFQEQLKRLKARSATKK